MTWVIRFNYSTGPEYLIHDEIMSRYIGHAKQFTRRAEATLALMRHLEQWHVTVTAEVVQLPPKLERGDT